MPQTEHLPDHRVNDEDDRALRDLFAAAFNPASARVFRHRRWLDRCPEQRWVIRSGGRIVSHAAYHDLRVKVGGRLVRVAAVAEVATLEAHRRRGYALALLECLHDHARSEGIEFAILFGSARLYESLGYRAPRSRVVHSGQGPGTTRDEDFRVLPLRAGDVPEGDWDLLGPVF